MTRHDNRLSRGLLTLVMIACLMATQATAQSGGNDLPTARDIWRHLPPLPGQSREPAPEPAPAPAPAPNPKPAPSALATSRPVAPPEAPPRSAPTPAPAPVIRSDAPSPVMPMASRTLAQARVVIHYPERGGYERSQELERLLRAVGTAEVERRAVRYAVDRQSIRYFHAADRDVSGSIADLIGVAGGGGRETVSDFTTFRPTPRNGTIEIWLPESRF